MDDGGLLSPPAPDPARHGARVCDNVIDALCRGIIPQPQPMEQRAHEQTRHRSGGFQIVLIKIPEIAHWRMAIADVRRVGPGDDPFGGPGLAGNDEIIAAQIQLLQRKRHQGKVFLVMPHASRKLLDKCRMDRVGRNGFGERLGAYDMRVDIRLWKNPAQGFDDFFSAAHTRKPVMDNGYAQMRQCSFIHAIFPRRFLWEPFVKREQSADTPNPYPAGCSRGTHLVKGCASPIPQAVLGCGVISMTRRRVRAGS